MWGKRKKNKDWLDDLFGMDQEETDKPIGESIREFAEQYDAASPEERDKLHGQLAGIAKLFGATDEQINRAKGALSIEDDSGLSPFRDKQKRLDKLEREYAKAIIANAGNAERLEDLKTMYEIERRKILES